MSTRSDLSASCPGSAESPRTQRSPLELDSASFQALLNHVATYLGQFLDQRYSAPAIQRSNPQVSPGHESDLLIESSDFPEQGSEINSLLEHLFHSAIPIGYDPTNPGYLAFIPGGGLPETAIADLITGIVNRYVGIRRAAPHLVAIDETVLSWFAGLVGYGPRAGGYLASGGSIANLTAIAMARHHRVGDRIESATIYASDQTHHSIAKSAVLAGISRAHVRSVPTDHRGRMRYEPLRAMVQADRDAGLTPFLLVSNAGTTNTGAIDDLQSAGQTARELDLDWHVDAAYGGFFLLTQRGRNAMKGLHQADSVTLDPHKSLFLPYGTGCLVVRDVQRLKSAFDLRGDYMPVVEDPSGRFDACDLSPEQTRVFRGLRIWLPVKRHGIDVFRQALDEKLDLTQLAFERLQQAAATGLPLQFADSPQLTVIAMRLAPSSHDQAQNDRMTDCWLKEIELDGRILLSPTRIAGQSFIRMCILGLRTHRDRIETAIEILLSAAKRTLAHASSEEEPT